VQSTTADRVRLIIATLFQTPIEEVTMQTSPETLPAWDSVGHLTLVLELEQEFAIALSPEDVEKSNDVASLVRSVERTLAS
jgi:acyl carrier protein